MRLGGWPKLALTFGFAIAGGGVIAALLVAAVSGTAATPAGWHAAARSAGAAFVAVLRPMAAWLYLLLMGVLSTILGAWIWYVYAPGLEWRRPRRDTLPRALVSCAGRELKWEVRAAKAALTRCEFKVILASDAAPGDHEHLTQPGPARQMAADCHVLVCICGAEYGPGVHGTKESLTELHFKEGVARDATKVLVYEKDGVRKDARQEDFLGRARALVLGEPGVRYERFVDPHDLKAKLERHLGAWRDAKMRRPGFDKDSMEAAPGESG